VQSQIYQQETPVLPLCGQRFYQASEVATCPEDPVQNERHLRGMFISDEGMMQSETHA